jgi:hypothetical protein
MNKKALFLILACLCIAASILMYVVGNNNDHLTELKDFWWMPLPLGGLLLLLAARTK